MDLQSLVRKNIWNLHPYSSARNEFKGEASVFLDANESPANDPYNRYPDPYQEKLKKQVGEMKGIDPSNILFGNGSDEPIDLVIRIFCEPRMDNIVAMDPSYGMYQVCAEINDVEYRKVQLNEDYSLNVENILSAVDEHTKIIFLCSPNNPTGNSLNPEAIVQVLQSFKGIVVVDEAYIDFSSQPSFLPELSNHSNLVILQTFSKAWGMAAIRLGMAFASIEIINLFNKVKYPYNINLLTQQFVGTSLTRQEEVRSTVAMLIEERSKLNNALLAIPYVEKIFPSDANFLLVKVVDANATYNYLIQQGIVIRNRHKVTLCENSIRITVGSPEENYALIEAMKQFK